MYQQDALDLIKVGIIITFALGIVQSAVEWAQWRISRGGN